MAINCQSNCTLELASAAVAPSVQRGGQLSASKMHIEKLHTSPAKELPELQEPRGRQAGTSPSPSPLEKFALTLAPRRSPRPWPWGGGGRSQLGWHPRSDEEMGARGPVISPAFFQNTHAHAHGTRTLGWARRGAEPRGTPGLGWPPIKQKNPPPAVPSKAGQASSDYCPPCKPLFRKRTPG